MDKYLRIILAIFLAGICCKSSATILKLATFLNHQVIQVKYGEYKVVSNIDLKGDTLDLSEGTNLKFDNVKIVNGVLIGNQIRLKGRLYKCFQDIYFRGSLSNKNISYKWFEEYTNDTELLRGMLSFLFSQGDYRILDLQPNREYLVWWPKMQPDHAIFEFFNQSRKRIEGNNATIRDLRTRTEIGLSSYDGIFLFDNCHGISIRNLHYINSNDDFERIIVNDKVIYNKGLENQIGYVGHTFILLQNDCSEFNIDSHIEGARYGIKSGYYSKYWLSGNYGLKKSKIKVRGYKTGYPVAIEIGDSLDIDVYSERHHRAAYLCGISNSQINIEAKDIYIAPYHCLLSDTRYQNKSDNLTCYKGCYNLEVKVTDLGSNIITNPHSFCIGLQTYGHLKERENPLVWENIKIKVNKKFSAPNIGLFAFFRRYDEVKPLNISDTFKDFYIKGQDKYESKQCDLRIKVNKYTQFKDFQIDIKAPLACAIMDSVNIEKINWEKSIFKKIIVSY